MMTKLRFHFNAFAFACISVDLIERKFLGKFFISHNILKLRMICVIVRIMKILYETLILKICHSVKFEVTCT